MDANGTRYQLLLGHADWGACLIDTPAGPQRLTTVWQAGVTARSGDRPPLAWDNARAEITLQPSLFPAGPADTRRALAHRRGAGADANGNRYWIDDDTRRIYVYSDGSGRNAPFWAVGDGIRDDLALPAGDFQPVSRPEMPGSLHGLAVTTEQYLVVGTLDPPGLLVFDLAAGGAPRQVLWPAAVAFHSFDMAPAPDGGLWILDRDPSGAAVRYWALDRHLDVLRRDQDPLTLRASQASAFQPRDGSPAGPFPAHTFPAGIGLTTPAGLAPRDPVAIAGLPDGTVLILDNGGDDQPGPVFSQIWRYAFGQPLGPPLQTRSLLTLVDPLARGAFALAGYDFAVLPAAPTPPDADGNVLLAHVFIVAQDGRQTYSFQLLRGLHNTLALEAEGGYYPMRLFGGKGLLISGDQPYYDTHGTWVPLVRQPRPRYLAEAIFYTPAPPYPPAPVFDGSILGTSPSDRLAFDGHVPGCVWHRLLIDGCFPPDSAIQVWSRATDAEADLPIIAWQREPDPIRRASGSEQPFAPASDGKDAGTCELLFQQARGRYLQLKIALQGNGRTTPHLHALRAYYPRFSYLDHYLPAIYRDDPPSASFLDRFLANIEGFYTGIEGQIAAVQMLFDVRSAPPEYLDWLAGWFGVVLDPHWEDARRRLFLSHAPQLFSKRGTLPGLLRILRLATDPNPDESLFDEGLDAQLLVGGSLLGTIRIVERFRTRLAPGVVWGDPTAAESPAWISADTTWTTAQGPGLLNARWQAWLAQQYGSDLTLNQAWGTPDVRLATLDLPTTQPDNPATAADWRRFLLTGLGLVYAPVTAADAPLYRDFLARRYGYIDALNAAYRRVGAQAYGSFAQVALPGRLPAGNPELDDWIQFASVVVAMHDSAHRFTVLVPTTVGDGLGDGGPLAERLRRVIELEKPSHTIYELKEYWALFRVGEARLGFDSRVDQGSRLLPTVLDQSYLAGSYLDFGGPSSQAERFVLSRGAPGPG